jgi:hypothetical protein
VTVLHTNDLHSHFRPEKNLLGLGGIARLKTAIAQERAANPNTVLIDGGDWSEGNIYYNVGAGLETLRMLEHLTYDVAVVGNHDWLNGPDQLLGIFARAQTKMALVGANLDLSKYPRADEFRRLIPPYAIREIGGVRIAFIGLATYELIYDSFFSPVRVTEPFSITRELARRLRSKADVIAVVSHNGVKLNERLLRTIPEVDLVIGAHDHKKLTRPIVVNRSTGPGWLVEAGCWGRYLGKVELRVLPRAEAEARGRPAVEFASYRLIQMDASVREDRETVRRVERLERALEDRYGDIFHDHIADNEVEITRDGGQENLMGNLTADAYLRATGADLALDQVALIYGELHPGEVHSVDVFNANPAVYDPIRDQAWTLKLLPVKGRTLRWIINVLYSSKALAQLGVISTAGMRITFDPLLQQSRRNALPFPVPAGAGPDEEEAQSILQEVLIGGRPLDKGATYRVAAGGGIVLAIRFLNSIIPNAIPLDGLEDTGLEDWRVLADHVRAVTPVTPGKIAVGNRIRSVQPDLGLLPSDVVATPLGRSPGGVRARVKVTVRNYGVTPSGPGSYVRIAGNRRGTDTTVDPDWVGLGERQPLPPLKTGEARSFEWEVLVPGEGDLYSVSAFLDGVVAEVNSSNDSITHWFKRR